jgi:hypothetical protein
VEAATRDNCRADFAFAQADGSFVDLLAAGTGPAEWEAFWAALRTGPFGVEACRDGESIPLPESARRVFAERDEASYKLFLSADNVTAGCTFHEDDLRLHINPREVVGESEFRSVLALMRFAAAGVRFPVFAVPEAFPPAHAFLRVSPDGRAEFLPAGSVRRTTAKSLWRRISGLIPGRGNWHERLRSRD